MDFWQVFVWISNRAAEACRWQADCIPARAFSVGPEQWGRAHLCSSMVLQRNGCADLSSARPSSSPSSWPSPLEQTSADSLSSQQHSTLFFHEQCAEMGSLLGHKQRLQFSVWCLVLCIWQYLCDCILKPEHLTLQNVNVFNYVTQYFCFNGCVCERCFKEIIIIQRKCWTPLWLVTWSPISSFWLTTCLLALDNWTLMFFPAGDIITLPDLSNLFGEYKVINTVNNTTATTCFRRHDVAEKIHPSFNKFTSS